MENAAESQQGEEEGRQAHFPPGTRATLTAAQQAARDKITSPEHIAKRNAGLAAYNALPLEEKRRLKMMKEAAKLAKHQQREAERAAKHAPPTEPVPPTVRSARGAAAAAPASSPPDTPRAAPFLKARTLIDLVAAHNVGDGRTFIQVTRTAPKTYQGMAVAGVQQTMWEALDDAEFASVYGGEAYDLRAYRISDHDNRRPIALSETIQYRVPGPPNLNALPNDEEPPMQPQRPVPGFNRNGSGGSPRFIAPATANAEADMLKTRLTHDETMDARHEERRMERERTAKEQDLDAVRLLANSHREEQEREDKRREREIKLVQQQNGGESRLVETLLQVMKPSSDPAESRALAQQHSQQIKELAESQKEEIKRLTESQRETIERLHGAHAEAVRRVEDMARADRTRLEETVRDADRRAAETVKDAERRAQDRVTDVQNQATHQYQDLKTRGEERLKDLGEQWQRRFDDLKESQSRELRAKDSEINLMRTNLESSSKVLLEQKDLEISRLKSEVRNARDEANQNKDWVGKMEEVRSQAEALGYTKPEPGEGGESKDEDLKTTAIKAGLTALTRMPEIIEAAGKTIGAVRGTGGGGRGPVPTEAVQAHARAGAVRQSMRSTPRQYPRLAFATEDSELALPQTGPQAASSAPPQPLPPLTPPQQQQEPQPAPVQQQELPFGGGQQQAPQQQAQPAHAPEPAPAMNPTTPSPAAEAPEPAGGAFNVEQILMVLPMLTGYYSSGQPPAAIVAHLITENSKETVASIISGVSPQQVMSLIAQYPDPERSKLVTREGQKFLRELWAEAARQVAT